MTFSSVKRFRAEIGGQFRMSTVSCILSSVRRSPVSGCGKGSVRRDVRFDSSCVRYFLLLSNRYSAKARKYSRYGNCDRAHE